MYATVPTIIPSLVRRGRPGGGGVAGGTHALGFSATPFQPGGVEVLGLDGGYRILAVEGRVVGLVHPLAATFAQEPAALVAARPEGGWDGRGDVGRRRHRRR